MTDIRIVQIVTPEAVTLDWLLTPTGELDTTQELATAATVALGTDRLALPADVLPDPNDSDRRGWWGDLDAEVIHDGWPIGTRLWLMSRDKITGPEARQGSTIARAEEFVREALQPFVDRQIATSVEVRAERTDTGRIDVLATFYRGAQPAIALRYADLWTEIGA
ncbi:phage GP46 family protein [Bosea sp. BK604]|uniref:phage GP46 family protein n=1 Tax=Bosea sp. BK604 TaxID=2512180 RepID=UPI00104333E3|nr:phage GP46 family protein [Bosea sp. BK604]TCR60932.1 phage gp46-like protein [Bosea sp. BK604]